jgi:hypothetical protein
MQKNLEAPVLPDNNIKTGPTRQHQTSFLYDIRNERKARTFEAPEPPSLEDVSLATV